GGSGTAAPDSPDRGRRCRPSPRPARRCSGGWREPHCCESAPPRPPNPRTASAAVRCIRHRSEEHTSELQSRFDLVCRLLLEKKKNDNERLTVTNLKRIFST